jgi:hypothetical protein
MTVRPILRHAAILTLAVVAGLGPALAQEDAFGEPIRYRERIVRRPVRVLPPPPAIISGYLPRNNAVPLYNEPPRQPTIYPYGR